MGLLRDYFAAASDEQAATAVTSGPAEAGFDAVCLPDLDAATTLAIVEARLVGGDEEEISDGPRFADMLAGTGGSWVFTVTDELQQAVATATVDRLAEVAAAVVDDPAELWHDTDDRAFAVGALTGLLKDLGDLSRRAAARNMRVYAWVSL